MAPTGALTTRTAILHGGFDGRSTRTRSRTWPRWTARATLRRRWHRRRHCSSPPPARVSWSSSRKSWPSPANKYSPGFVDIPFFSSRMTTFSHFFSHFHLFFFLLILCSRLFFDGSLYLTRSNFEYAGVDGAAFDGSAGVADGPSGARASATLGDYRVLTEFFLLACWMKLVTELLFSSVSIVSLCFLWSAGSRRDRRR